MNLSYGSRGNEVTKLQQGLNKAGYKLQEDGIFGDRTQAALMDYQTKNNLTADGSGIFGAETSGKLYGTGAAQNSPTAGQNQPQTVKPSPGFAADPMSDAAYKTASENYQAALKQGAPQYNSIYDDQMNALFDKIMNRQDFSYDLKNDPMYAQYRDQYTQQGQMAMMDTMGQAAALTGGYGNTYGQAVGQQQYNAYLQQLNDVVPELYDRAYGRYQQEGQDLMNQYALTADREADDYGRYMDSYNQYWDNIGFLQGEEDRAYDRGMAADELAYGRQQDAKSYLLDLMAATGYVPSAEELAAAGMSQGEADAWMKLYAPKGGSGGVPDYTGIPGDDNYLQMVLGRMGIHDDPSIQRSILYQYADVLTPQELAIGEAELAEAEKRYEEQKSKKNGNAPYLKQTGSAK